MSSVSGWMVDQTWSRGNFGIRLLMMVTVSYSTLMAAEFKHIAGKYLPPFHEIFVKEIPIQKLF